MRFQRFSGGKEIGLRAGRGPGQDEGQGSSRSRRHDMGWDRGREADCAVQATSGGVLSAQQSTHGPETLSRQRKLRPRRSASRCQLADEGSHFWARRQAGYTAAARLSSAAPERRRDSISSEIGQNVVGNRNIMSGYNPCSQLAQKCP